MRLLFVSSLSFSSLSSCPAAAWVGRYRYRVPGGCRYLVPVQYVGIGPFGFSPSIHFTIRSSAAASRHSTYSTVHVPVQHKYWYSTYLFQVIVQWQGIQSSPSEGHHSSFVRTNRHDRSSSASFCGPLAGDLIPFRISSHNSEFHSSKGAMISKNKMGASRFPVMTTTSMLLFLWWHGAAVASHSLMPVEGDHAADADNFRNLSKHRLGGPRMGGRGDDTLTEIQPRIVGGEESKQGDFPYFGTYSYSGS